MKKFITSMLLGLFILTINAQSLSVVRGSVIDSYSTSPLGGVRVSIAKLSIEQTTDTEGNFILQNVPTGSHLLELQYPSYESQSFPINVIDGSVIDLGTIFLYEEIVEQSDLSIISLSEEQLSNDEGGADNTAGLLQYSKDIFLSTAAYEFSSTFFRARGYSSENGKVLINGIEMNKMYNGRPQWSNWGGLNDAQRNQELANGLAPSDFTFGGIAGSNNIIMRASEYKEGGKVSVAFSNRSYKGRMMGSYATGLTKKGWALSILASRRYGIEGYFEATMYDANSFLMSIEKKINDKHSLNFTAFYTPNRRGKSSPNTQEVFDLKETTYNSYWGKQAGKKRNSRRKEIKEPVFMLNHYWDINDATTLNTNIAYQTGTSGNSRLDYGGMTLAKDSSGNDFLAGGGSNPDPTYYQKLPSYFLRYADNPDYEKAYLAEQQFINDGQIDWNSLYQANLTAMSKGRNSVYVLYEDRNDDSQFTFNSILRTELKENIDLNASLSYRKLTSKNFASMLDLLGGTGYLNVDSFSETLEEAQNDLKNPNRIVQVGDKFKYNYEMDASILDAFAQAQFKYTKMDFYVAAKLSKTNYQRNGLNENGRFPGSRSYGKSEKVDFTNFSAKGGLTYKISGRHLVNFNAGYLTKAPTIRNSFSNSRENNDVVIGLTDEKITSLDVSYILRTPKIQARLTGYYTKFKDATEIAFYYADGIYGISNSETSAFVQEVLTGISKRNIGLEIGLTVQVTSTIKLKGAAALGDYVYDNNPNLYLASDDFEDVLDFGESALKNYHVAGGPQRAVSVGFEYRDPDYWWFGTTLNYFSNGYLDISPLARTSNFVTDPETGQPFNDYDPEIARELLAQEEFDNYFIVNAIGGKSWKVDNYYLGFFATINNILNSKYKTGGFEQSRNANYRTLSEDKARDTPVFGPKYWFGYGTTYYLSFYVRF